MGRSDRRRGPGRVLGGPHRRSFADEYAYITQSYYADLFFTGQVNDPGMARLLRLRSATAAQVFHRRRVASRQPSHAAGPRRGEMVRRLHDRSGPRRPHGRSHPIHRWWASWGAWPCSGAACWSVGRVVGTFAALLLIINPLYRLHAHRAMSEVPCEAFHGRAWGWPPGLSKRSGRGRRLPGSVCSGFARPVCCGLSILCKFNGLLAPDHHDRLVRPQSAPSAHRLEDARPHGSRRLPVDGPGGGTYVALNPALTARPTVGSPGIRSTTCSGRGCRGAVSVT